MGITRVISNHVRKVAHLGAYIEVTDRNYKLSIKNKIQKKLPDKEKNLWDQ